MHSVMLGMEGIERGLQKKDLTIADLGPDAFSFVYAGVTAGVYGAITAMEQLTPTD